MATKQVTITVDEGLLALFREQAERQGMKISPFIALAARNWLALQATRELAAYDHAHGADTEEYAEAEYALRLAAEAADAKRRRDSAA